MSVWGIVLAARSQAQSGRNTSVENDGDREPSGLGSRAVANIRCGSAS